MSVSTETRGPVGGDTPGLGGDVNGMNGDVTPVLRPTTPPEDIQIDENSQNNEASASSQGRNSPVSLKISNKRASPDTSGSLLEMVVEKVKARENSTPTMGSPNHKPLECVPFEKHRRNSNDSEDSSMTKLSESNTDEIKEDEEDNEEDEEKISPGENIDPERLKAFNMFVRLFVDENLDRTVPISKQPKDKIQAILEACDRQFSEFHDRSRKRVRTYLKSCRRLKRTKDGNGYEQVKQTPPHLTSAAAESILAQACENESQNAKRMRMGLEPLPAHLMNNNTKPRAPTPPKSETPTKLTREHTSPGNKTSEPRTQPMDFLNRKRSSDLGDFSPIPAKLSNSSSYRLRDLGSPYTNGSTGFRSSGFPTSLTGSPAHLSHTASLLQSSLTGQLQNGPTDLSIKNKTSPAFPGSKRPAQLSLQEVTTIKALIAGYRESAAFLYRSADELESLLNQQN